MKRSSVMSRSFFRRPAVRELVPDLKLLLVVLTVSCESSAGVYIPSGCGEDSGLDAAAVEGGLADLESLGLIVRDPQTGEAFLCDFYRDNTFTTPSRRGQWRDDYRRIESARLRRLVLDAAQRSPECGLADDVSGIIELDQALTTQDKVAPQAADNPTIPLNQGLTAQGKGREGKGSEGEQKQEGAFRRPSGAAQARRLAPARSAGVVSLVSRPSDVDENLWHDFLVLRKAKNAPLTETALEAIRVESQKAKISLSEALKVCCARGWPALRAEWLTTDSRPVYGSGALRVMAPRTVEPDWSKIDYGDEIQAI